jgi:hypothetical protein
MTTEATRTGCESNRWARKSGIENCPARRNGAARNRRTTTKPAAKPVANQIPSSPDAYTAPATPRKEAAEK